MALRITIVVFISTIISYFHVMSNLEIQTKQQLDKYITQRGQRESFIFQLSQDNVKLLSKNILQEIKQPVAKYLNAEFDRIYFNWDDGTIRNFPQNHSITEFDPALFASSFIGKTIQISERDKHILLEYYPETPELLQEKIDEINLEFITEDSVKILASMNIGTIRIREIVKSLRSFSRLDEAEYKKVDIHEGIDNTLLILQHRLKHNSTQSEIKIIKDYAEISLVECYAGKLNQVFMNILGNAIDALSTLETSNTTANIFISTQIINANWVRICIADNGAGMTEEVCKNIFNPFFTTKPVGKGTGLGLSISYQIIVETHKGKIYCDSELGKGTKFVIEIPIRQWL